MLRLLALACIGLKATGLEEYRPPSEALPEALVAEPEAPVARGEERRQEIADAAAALGGEAG